MRGERLGACAWFARIWFCGRSGLSARAFCLRQGISYSTMLAWRKRLQRELAGGSLSFRRYEP